MSRFKEAPTQPSTPVFATVEGISVRNTSVAVNERVELPFTDSNYAPERQRATEKWTPKGIKPLTDEETEEEHKLTSAFVKKAATEMFGTDTSKTSFPVAFSEPRSLLERLSDIFSALTSEFIQKSMDAEDQASRLRIFTVGVIAALHLDMQSKKPFNPILGESYFCKWPNNVFFYAEQTSHHPPISDIYIIPEDKSWKCSGHIESTTNQGLNAVSIKCSGALSIEFADDILYQWEMPTIRVLGSISGDRIIKVKGPLVVKDTLNDLECVIDIHPKDKKRVDGESFATTIIGGVRVTGEKGHPPPEIRGDFCKQVSINGEVVWNIDSSEALRPNEVIANEDLLPSDCRFRLDRCLFIQGKLNEADDAKIALEQAQRREEELRSGSTRK
jgi:hypothetical protein